MKITLASISILIAALCLGVSFESKVSVVRAAYPGINGKIAFLSHVPGGQIDIYTMNSDGSAITNVTNTSWNEQDPSWSPDGTRIAFGTFEMRDIFVISADGSGLTNITAQDDAPAENPDWSPDGSKIVYVCHLTLYDPGEICVINADGSGRTSLTNNTWLDYAPAWSPDGTRIAFASAESGPEEIYLIDPDGANQINLTNNGATDTHPAWAPDGSKIAFESGPFNRQIHTINSDGSGYTNVSNSQFFDLSPAWSPDGLFIMFSSARNGVDYDLIRMRADGSEQNAVCQAAGDQDQPSWQPLISEPAPIGGALCPVELIVATPPSIPLPGTSPEPTLIDFPRGGARVSGGEGDKKYELPLIMISATLVGVGMSVRFARRRWRKLKRR